MEKAVQDQKSVSLIITMASGLMLLLFFAIFVSTSLPSSRSKATSSVLSASNNKQISGPVQVSGEVSDVIGTRSLVVSAYGPLSEDVLVISRDPLVPVGGGGIDDFFFEKKDTVSITGNVQTFNLRAIEEELGVDLRSEEYAKWQGKPVVIAERVEKK